MSDTTSDVPGFDDFRAVFLEYTRMAFHSLPRMVKPSILDAGCGTGVCTLELARLTDGIVTGIDVDPAALAKLDLKIHRGGLAGRMITKRCSLLDPGLGTGCFDVIWAEGVIHVIGFPEGLRAAHGLLKPGGFLVMAEAIEGMERNKSLVAKCGFELRERIDWEKGCWLTRFYEPLEKELGRLRAAGAEPTSYAELSAHEGEIAMVRDGLRSSDCAHYVLQKVTMR